MQVQFLDTDPHASASVPTILAVHGAPGNYADYAPVIHKLRQKGFRIIAPNFPGTSFTAVTAKIYYSFMKLMTNVNQ